MTLTQCQQARTEELLSYPTINEISNFNFIKQKVVTSAKNQLELDGMSPLHDIIDRVHWVLPPIYEKARQISIKIQQQAVANKFEWNSTFRRHLDKINQSPESLGYVVVKLATTLEDSLFEPLRPMAATCKKDLERPFGHDDGSYIKSDMLLVSNDTVVGNHNPVFVLGHELGHKVYSMAQKKPAQSFASQLTCLRGRHDKIDLLGERFLEEDYADFFGVRISQTLDAAGSIYDLFCHHAINSKSLISLVHQNSKDSHSPDLFRLLSIAAQLGDAPPVCQIVATEARAMKLLAKCGP